MSTNSPREDAEGAPTAAAVVPGGLPALVTVCRAFTLLAGIAMSLGLAGWTLRIGEPLHAYVTTNALPPSARHYVFLNMGMGIGVALLLSATLLIWKRRAGVDLLRRISHRLAPLLLAWAVPLLFDWRLWRGRDQQLVVLIGVFALGLQGLCRLAFSTPPVFDASVAARVRGTCSRVVAWLGRIPATRWLPVSIVLLSVAGYTAFFGFHTARNHYRIGTAAMDVGLENNLVWNAMQLGPLFKSSPIGGPDASHAGFHQTYFAYVLSIPYRLAPGPVILLWLQAFLMGAAAVPLYFLGRRRFRPWLAAGIALLYLFYPPLHGANLYEFHYLPFAPLFLWSSLYFLEERRYVLAAVAILFTLSVREDVSALLCIAGAYLVLTGERPIPGLVVCFVGAAYFVVVKLIVMPRILHGGEAFVHQYQDLLPEGDGGYVGVMKTVLGNPVFTLGTLLDSTKVTYLLKIMAPLAFLPWRRPIGLLCIVPGFIFTLLSTKYPPLIEISFQYTTYWTAFLFVAIIANLHWLGSGERGETHQSSRRAWIVALFAASLVSTYEFGAVLQQHTARGGFGPFRFDLRPADIERRARLEKLIARVPPLAKIVSSERIVPHVSNRPNSYTMRTGIYDAEYLLASVPLPDDEKSKVAGALRSGRYGVIAVEGEYVLARLGHSTAGNAAVIERNRL